MKRTGLIGLSLTLTMLLLVLVAAFIFLFQGRQVLERRAENLAAESELLRQERAQAESALAVSEATRLAAVEALETAEAANVLLEGQLVASQQEADTLSTRVAELTGEIGDSGESRPEPTATATPGPPQVTIVAPEDGVSVVPGEAVNIIVAAADAAGITAVNLTIDDEAFESYSVDEALLFTASESWTPTVPGTYVLGAIAVNSHGLASETITTTVIVSPTALSQWRLEIGDWLISNLNIIDNTDNDSPYRRLLPVENLASAVAFVNH